MRIFIAAITLVFCAAALTQPIPPPVAYPIAVNKGGTAGTTAPDDNIMLGSGTNWVRTAVSNCVDTGGNHLNYTAATNAFSCGTSSAGGSAAGSTGQVQYNNAGAFGGAAEIVVDTVNDRVGINKPVPTFTLDVVGNMNVLASGVSEPITAITSNGTGGLAFGTTSAGGTAFLSFRTNGQTAYIQYEAPQGYMNFSNKFFIYPANGHLTTYNQSGAPSATTCGTSPSVSGNDVNGTITVGSGVVTACTLTFLGSWATAPQCFFTPNADVNFWKASASTSAYTINSLASMSGVAFDYLCLNKF